MHRQLPGVRLQHVSPPGTRRIAPELGGREAVTRDEAHSAYRRSMVASERHHGFSPVISLSSLKKLCFRGPGNWLDS